VRFDVAAEAYDRFKGRYSVLIAPQFTDFAAVRRDRGRADLREGCRQQLGDGPFTVTGRAWAARARP